jgi:hypothetical protein
MSSPERIAATGTYTVDSNCIGTMTIRGRNWDMYVAQDGSEGVGTRTDDGTISAQTFNRAEGRRQTEHGTKGSISRPGPMGALNARTEAGYDQKDRLQRLFTRVEEPLKGSFIQDDSPNVGLSKQRHSEDALEQLHFAVEGGRGRLSPASYIALTLRQLASSHASAGFKSASAAIVP